MTVAFNGIEAVPVDVQVMVGPGKHTMHVVGLADKAVAESRERVQAALHASGLSLPPKKITINLAPADLPKGGSHYDLPIALALMAALDAIPNDVLEGYVAMGELALDGTITHVAGALPAAIGANAMDKGLICSEASGGEAAWAGANVGIIAPRSLVAIANHFKGTQVLGAPKAHPRKTNNECGDMTDIRGQDTAKRALEIAAAGGHNLLLVGPPGCGKSMLASRLPSILPPLTPRELLEISMIESIAGELADGKLSAARPFRSPHHSASMAAMVGGGTHAKPGEVSLAHNGVLFLDELPEFSPQVLNSLRQPLETGETIIARANHRVSYPSRLQLIAAMNPCQCGKASEPGHQCRRGTRCVTDYQARISGPLLDRIDLCIEVPAISTAELITQPEGEPSKVIAQRVLNARKIQYQRHKKLNGVQNDTVNAHLSNSNIEAIAMPDDEGKKLLEQVSESIQLSARGFHRMLKVARTIADLDNSKRVKRSHLGEAVSYRLARQQISQVNQAA